MNKIIFYIFGIFAFLVFTNTEIYACSCIQRGDETVAQQVGKAKNEARAVFSGKVLEVIREPGKYEVTVKLRVEKSWKGNVSRQITVSTASDSAMCGYNFEVGKSYLIYASGTDANNLQTNICTRTASFSQAKSDLRALGKGRIPKI